jgi:hypothetical protein
MSKEPLYPHKPRDSWSEETTTRRQLNRLPGNLGHGWYSDEVEYASDPTVNNDASRIQQKGYHIALFKEGNGVRIWHSEVASNDPLDENGKVYRWFDYRSHG